MSIFIASLAFTDPDTLDLAKVGVVAGSLISAVAGIFVLRSCPAEEPDDVIVGG
jgi:NhaA family Na+:H+ antiporter